MKILYVCHNNKGRSIALAEYTKYFLKKRDINDIKIESAGIDLENIMSLRKKGIDKASRTIIQIMAEQGFDISSHKIKYIEEVISHSDLIIPTDMLTIEKICVEYPKYYEICVLAREVAGYLSELDILGPCHESRRDPKDKNWTEKKGYIYMLAEIKNISRRIVKNIAEELYM